MKIGYQIKFWSITLKNNRRLDWERHKDNTFTGKIIDKETNKTIKTKSHVTKEEIYKWIKNNDK